jgi:hypothetical protein
MSEPSQPRRFGLTHFIVGTFSVLMVLYVGFIVYKIAFDDASTAGTAYATLNDNLAANEPEYLVFLREDSPPSRDALFSAVSSVSFVSESAFPKVIVVRLNENPSTALAALDAQENVRMVIKYVAAFGCH